MKLRWLQWRDSLACSTNFALLLLVFTTVIGWLWLDSRIPFPYIFADETGFLIPAHAIADPDFHPDGGGLAYALRSQSPVHSLLFSVVFDSGDGFFAHAKLINCLLCGLMIIPAWLIARRIVSPGAALCFAALVGMNPWNSLTAHFMPESLYGFIFWWMAWAFLTSLGGPTGSCWRPLATAAGCGLLGALLFFTKPHALTLLPACGGAFLLRTLRDSVARNPRWWLGLLQATVFTLVVLGSMAGFASAAGRTLSDVIFAGRYQGQAGGIFSLENLELKLDGLWRQTSGHLGHAGVLYAVPFAVGALLLWRAVRPIRPGQERLVDLTVFAALSFMLTLGVTIKFACDIMLTIDPNDIHRLSERYYGFLLPLIALPLLAVSHGTLGWTPRILAALIATGSAVLIVTQRGWYRIHAHDAPQYYWLSPATDEGRPIQWFVWVALGVAGAHVIYFLVSRRYDWRAFFLTGVVVCAAATIRTEQVKFRDSRSAPHFHAFAQMTRQIVEADWRHMIVVGDPGMVSIYLFMLDGLPLSVILPPDAPVPADRIPPGTRWIVRLHQHALPEGLKTESVFRYIGNGALDISRVLP